MTPFPGTLRFLKSPPKQDVTSGCIQGSQCLRLTSTSLMSLYCTSASVRSPVRFYHLPFHQPLDAPLHTITVCLPIPTVASSSRLTQASPFTLRFHPTPQGTRHPTPPNRDRTNKLKERTPLPRPPQGSKPIYTARFQTPPQRSPQQGNFIKSWASPYLFQGPPSAPGTSSPQA